MAKIHTAGSFFSEWFKRLSFNLFPCTKQKRHACTCVGSGVSPSPFLLICLLWLGSPKVAEDRSHFYFAGLFLCDLGSGRNRSAHCCHPCSVTAERWGPVGGGSRWDGARLLLGLAPAAGLVVGHALLLLPFQPS